MAVNLSAIKDLLLPGLRGVEGKYEMIPSQYDKIFTKHDSKLALERTAEMRYLGLAQLKTEGGQTSFDNNSVAFDCSGKPFPTCLSAPVTRSISDTKNRTLRISQIDFGTVANIQARSRTHQMRIRTNQ